MRAFASSKQEDEIEALAIDEVEPIEAMEEALESLSSLSEQETVLEDGEKTKKTGSRGKDKITGVSRGSDEKAPFDRRDGAEPLSPVDQAIAGLFKTEEYLKEIMEEEQILYNQQILRREEDEDLNIASYLEDASKINVLKQVVTDPDYQAREKFLGKASPKAASIQEEKARALSKLAAYNKSADILKLIKNRMGSDQEMQKYMVDELSKTGSDLATFMASEIKMENRKAKDVLARSEALALQAQQKEDLKLQKTLKRPIDSFTFGAAEKFGINAFAPANELDRLEKHDKNRIGSFKEYQEHLDKIGLKAEQVTKQRQTEKYDELFERYQIAQADRKYVFISDLEKMDHESDEYRTGMLNFAKLMVKIPELFFEATKPTMNDVIENSLRQFHRNEMIELSYIEAARQPYIEKQLKEQRATFDKQTQSMSEADREIAWAKIEQQHQQTARTDFDFRTKQFWEKASGRLEAYRRSLPSYEKTPAEIMVNLKYQKIKDSSSSPLSIDRVTQDGPRDLIGELKETLKRGPVYDLSKNPGSTVLTEVESAIIDGREINEPENASPKNPVSQYLEKVSGLRDHLEENYDYAKQIESAIEAQRKKMASDLLAIQTQLTQVQNRKGSLQKLIHETHIKEIERQVLPTQNLYDFIEFEANEATLNQKTLLQDELNQLLKSQTLFDPQSKEPEAYEQELKVLSQYALLNQALGKPNDQLEHFLYVFGQMKANKIMATTQIHARMFEYAVLAEKPQVANDLLVDLTKDRSEALSPIDPRFLRSFFEQSLKRDNIDGVAHIVNYGERYGIDMSSYPINNFRSALDYYLNKKFDLSKVMVFLNFYQKHFSDRARHAFDKIESAEQVLSDETIHAVSKQIFGKSDGLVDLPSLFEYLVQSVGKRQVIDPFSNSDSLWKLIESQITDKDYIRAASMTGNSNIGGRQVAQYLGNQFERASSFDRTFKTALRLEGTPMADSFFKELMQQLNAYSLSNRNQLPRSFSEKNLSDLYLRLKLSGAQLSLPMSELLLYSLNKKEMHREIVDYCTSDDRIKSDVEKYYLAESLLQGKVNDQSYSAALRKSKIFDSNENLSACQLTLKTKALFLDGSPKTAIDTFKKDLEKREEQARKRKDLMVALFDNVMTSDRNLTFEEFKKKHQKSALFSRRIVAQAYAASTLQKIVKNNDYDGIENAFNLYMVMRQEQEITNEKFMLDDQGNVTQISNNKAKLSYEQLDKLEKLRERKAHLQKMLHIEDYQRIKELLEISKGQKIELMASLDPQGLERVLDIFRDMSFEEARKYSSAEREASGSRTDFSKEQKSHSKKDSLQTSQSIEQAEDAAEKESEIDWFEAFATQKAARKQKAYVDVINEYSKPMFQKDKDEQKLAQHWFVLQKKEKNFAKLMASPERDKYLKSLDDWVNKNVGKTEDKDLERINAEKEIKMLDELDVFFEKIDKGADLDPVREAELSFKVQLDAKINVLKKELQEKRFASEFNKKEQDEARDYARTIALLRLEAKDLEQKLAEIQSIPKAKITSPFYRSLYNIKDDDEDSEALYRNYEVLMTENDPHVILDHFSKGDGMNREQFLKLDEDLANAQILPDAYKAIEEKAIKSAEKFFEIRKKKEDAQSETGYEEERDIEDENRRHGKKSFLSSKKVKIDENTRWEAVLRQSELLHQSQVYDHYYIGRKRASAEKPYSHLRELLDDIQDQELSDDARGDRIIRRLGLDMPSASDDESDADIREQAEYDAIEEKVNAEVLAKQNNVIHHPLEYFERMGIRESLDNLRSKQLRDFAYDMDNDENDLVDIDAIKRYNDRMLNDGIDPNDNNDPINYQRKAHDASLIDLKEGLTKAVGERKAHALPLAIQIFNRIQEKTVKVTKLDDFIEERENPDQDIQNITAALDKVQILLNDSSSPILSNLRQSSKYSTQKLPETIDEYRWTVKNGDILNQPVDLNEIINDYRSLCKTEDHLANIKQTLTKVEKQLKSNQDQIKDRVLKSSFDKFVEDAQKETQDSQDAYLRRLYNEYKQAGKDDSEELSRDQKVHLMRDVFRVELGEDFINTEEGKADSGFPAFYALDLIQFGLKREIPAAIRLGELLLTENCANHSQAVMPKELARAVKDYMLENQEKYLAAAQFTGPINNTQIYHQARQTNGGDAVFFTADDPYWIEFKQRNYRREDNWKGPSIFAWDHKPFGILGEVLDLKRFERTLREHEMKL